MPKFHTAFLALFAAAACALSHAEPAPQVNALFRVLKADGKTVIGQVLISPAGTVPATIPVRQADAIVAANGRCAFNVRYDEVSSRAVTGSVNRIYSNDTLVAQNSGIDLQANVLKSITTQPYLAAGQNNVKIVLNAESAAPSVGWVRIVVDGACNGAAPAPAPAASAVAASASAPKPQPKPAEPPVVPGSALWNPLFNAWGYSNYAVTQLRGRNYARYADVVALNAALTAAVNAKSIGRGDCEALLARWNALAADAGFKAAMATVLPPAPGASR